MSKNTLKVTIHTDSPPLEIGSELSCIPDSVSFLLKYRSDLQHLQDSQGNIYLNAAYVWWSCSGSSQYPFIRWNIAESHREHLHRIKTIQLSSNINDDVVFSEWMRYVTPFNLFNKTDWELQNYFTNESSNDSVLLPYFLLIICNSNLNAKEIGESDKAGWGVLELINWWFCSGNKEYQRIDWSLKDFNKRLDELNETKLLDSESAGIALRPPTFILFLYRERKDLRAIFQTFSCENLISLLKWWLQFGVFEYPGIKWGVLEIIQYFDGIDKKSFEGLGPTKILSIQGFIADILGEAELQTSLLNMPSKVCPSLPIFLSLLSKLEDVVCNDIGPEKSFDRSLRIFSWWLNSGQEKYHSVQWDFNDLCIYLDKLFGPGSIEENLIKCEKPLPGFLLLIYLSRKDLQKLFPVINCTTIFEIFKWWFARGVAEYPVLKWTTNDLLIYLRNFATIALPENGLVKFENVNNLLGQVAKSSVSNAATNYNKRQRKLNKADGVNVIGFSSGTLGLGEDARLMGASLKFNNIKFSFVDAPISGPKKEHYEEVGTPSTLDNYRCTILTLPPTDIFRIAIESCTSIFNEDKYVIAAMPWELPYWPKEFSGIFEKVDEVWAPSQFVIDAFKDVTDKEVSLMPTLVTVPKPVSDKRASYGFDAQHFIFYILFDGNSWLSRKNPIAAVKAFCRAFPANEGGNVRLLIKAMNINSASHEWNDILKIVSVDKRIIIETRSLSRQKLIDLMASCDCYVSLHRSEGFGRVLAEAMLLGQPVIATNYSGNIDFCTDETSYLVDGPLLSLKKGDYPLWQGQFWCDPDIDLAVTKMRSVVGDPALRDIKVKAAKININELYGIEAVAKHHEVIFKQIGLC